MLFHRKAAKFLSSFRIKRGSHFGGAAFPAYNTRSCSAKRGNEGENKSKEESPNDQEGPFEKDDPTKILEKQSKIGGFLWTIGLFAGVGGAFYFFFFRNRNKKPTDGNLIEGVMDS